MIEELTSFEIRKIFGDDLEKSTYKLLYDLILVSSSDNLYDLIKLHHLENLCFWIFLR